MAVIVNNGAPNTGIADSEKKAKTAKKVTKKKVAKKKVAKKAAPRAAKASKAAKEARTKAQRAALAAMTRQAISKHTKGAQKQIGLNEKPFAVVSSGSLPLNNLIGGNLAKDKSGPICPGYPRRHITEIYGPEASGKTTLTLEAIAECQRAGGVCMFLDFEHALHHGYARQIGVSFDPDKLMLFQPDYMEQGLDMMRIGIKTGVDLVVIDSVAAMVPKGDMEKKYEDPDKIGGRAAKLASALPRVVKQLHEKQKYGNGGTAVIFINQERATITSRGGGKGTSGGKALKFFAFLRLEVIAIKKEIVEKVDPVTKKKHRVPYGTRTMIKVAKSKAEAKAGYTANLFLRHGFGVDDYFSTIESGVGHKIVKKDGAYYQYGEYRFQGREKFRAFLMDNSKIFKSLQDDLLGSILRSQQDFVEEDDLNEGETVDDVLTEVGLNADGEETYDNIDDEIDEDDDDDTISSDDLTPDGPEEVVVEADDEET